MTLSGQRAGLPADSRLPGRRVTWGAAIILSVAYLLTRGYRLEALPMFFDEATHLLWADSLRLTGDWAGPQRAGKGLAVVAIAGSLGVIEDPLLAARGASALVGLLGFLATLRLGHGLGGGRLGVVTAVFAITCPFALFHERLGLADPYVSALTALTLALTVDTLRRPRALRGVGLGLAMTGAALAKATGLLALALPLAGAIPSSTSNPRPVRRTFLVAYAVAVALLAVPIGYFLATTAEIQDKTFLGTSLHGLSFLQNARQAIEWLWFYWTPPIFVLCCVGALRALTSRRRVELLLVVGVLLPIGAFALTARSWFPRYLLPTTVPAMVLAARGACELATWLAGRYLRLEWVLAAVVLAALVPAVAFDAALLRDPTRTPLPEIDRFQYVEGWPSGYGWAEIAQVLDEELKGSARDLTVVTEPMNPILAAYFMREPRVRVRGVDLQDPEARSRVLRWADRRDTYLVLSEPAPRPDWGAPAQSRWVAGFSKPGHGMSLSLYRIDPQGAR